MGLALPPNTAIAGELSLAGEVRPVRRLASRIKTAGSLGFGNFLGPRGEGSTEESSAGNLTAAMRRLFTAAAAGAVS
jgi:DNA repair protein RadA/Sms